MSRSIDRRAIGVFCLVVVLTVGIGGYFAWRAASFRIEYSLFPTDSGWGYDIVAGVDTMIHQPFIPALQGDRPFPTERSARRAARAVIRKLQRGDSPALSPDEVRRFIDESTP